MIISVDKLIANSVVLSIANNSLAFVMLGFIGALDAFYLSSLIG